MTFSEFPVITTLYLAVLVGVLLWGVYLIFRRFQLPGEADHVHSAQVENGDISAKIDKEAFCQSYIRTEAPRFANYLCVAALICLVLVPFLAVLFFQAASPFYELAQTRGLDRTTTIFADMAGGVVQFVLVMGVCVGILFATIYTYYRRRPPSHRSVIRKLEAEANER
jgi:multisubunit Na+/H+ antiporter MnhB subunit